MQVGVVAHPEERLRIASGRLGIQVRNDDDLVLPANHRQDAPDRRISKRGVDVSRTLDRRRSHPPRRRVFDRNQAGRLREPAHRLFMHRGKDAGRRERR